MANVITYGTFDFFHEGHRRILERAREYCGEGHSVSFNLGVDNVMTV